MRFRSPLTWACCALLACLSVGVTHAQAKFKLKGLYGVKPATAGNAAANAATTSTPSLPLFTYDLTSSRDHQHYSGVIVGRNAFKGGGAVNVSTYIVPLIIKTHLVATGINKNGILSTAGGTTVFNSTIADPNIGSTNNVPVKLVQQSPFVQAANINFGGTMVGRTQYLDAFQRASFWNVINRDIYHVKLNPVRTLAAVTIDVPTSKGLSIPPALFGGNGSLGIIDINFFDAYLDNVVLPKLVAQGVNPGTFPIFLLHNVVESFGTSPRDLNFCCVLGYHGTNGSPVQTYSPSDFETTGLFGGVADTSVLSHEIGEWANDPFGTNATPLWGHTGQVPNCQGNLEVGDPLSGTLAPPIKMPNGFTYHFQELAFFSWFYGAPSIGVNGWFSDNATFLQDAGPPCQ